MSTEIESVQDSESLWNRFINLFKSSPEISLRESLEEAIEEHEEETNSQVLGDGERVMLFNILEYGALRVSDIMVPRADIVAVSLETEFGDLIKLFSGAGHSRIPVYRDSLDDVMGMVHVKDALKIIADEGDVTSFRVSQISRPVLFVSPAMKVMDLLAKMRASRTHMAIVVDEYGGTDGLLTIEDLVEEIVGDIEDEHDQEEEPDFVTLGNGKYDADARLEIVELEEALGVAISSDEDEYFDTLGGLVFSLAGHVPEIGEMIDHESGYRFEIIDADPRRIRKVRIHAPHQE
ncbi:hemolysin C [Kordiimonas sediminis]|uniref:Hemolysin C n=1 Tax=Kordiimonas sediminis TaxID=1735581 RepID=A0A919AMP6_9PROT|nr:hemolysin family protein [Kordiimonas sediminis]GHF16287.1 hemolysin C [Kordiimonas sediminis]